MVRELLVLGHILVEETQAGDREDFLVEDHVMVLAVGREVIVEMLQDIALADIHLLKAILVVLMDTLEVIHMHVEIVMQDTLLVLQPHQRAHRTQVLVLALHHADMREPTLVQTHASADVREDFLDQALVETAAEVFLVAEVHGVDLAEVPLMNVLILQNLSTKQ